MNTGQNAGGQNAGQKCTGGQKCRRVLGQGGQNAGLSKIFNWFNFTVNPNILKYFNLKNEIVI